MHRRSLISLTAIIAGTAIGLAFVEFAVRLLFPDQTRTSIVLRLKNERPVWATPDAKFHHVGDGIFHLNFPTGTEPTGNRVLIIGDSFAMGHGVGEEKRFAHLLQQHLGQAAKVDVLATTSYSPVIYRNVLKKALTLAQYRAVAIFLDQTDPVDDMIYDEDVIEEGSSLSFDVVRMADRARVFDRAYSDLLTRFSGTANFRRLASVNLLLPLTLYEYFKPRDKYYRYARLSLGRSALIGEFNINPDSEQSRTMSSLMSKHLDQLVAQCRERQVPLLLFANPWEFQSAAYPRVTLQLSGPFPKDNRLERFLASRYANLPGVYVIPLTHSFREQKDPSSLFLDNPGHEIHWNENGHLLVEAVLRQHLMDVLPDLRANH